jgi:hypothetical protein
MTVEARNSLFYQCGQCGKLQCEQLISIKVWVAPNEVYDKFICHMCYNSQGLKKNGIPGVIKTLEFE